MEDNEKEWSGISFGDIFRIIFSQIWLALIIAAVVTVACTLGLYYGRSGDTRYSVTFEMRLPGSESSPQSYIYPDGTLFHYNDIISVDNIVRVKEESGSKTTDEFVDVDIAGLIEKGDISISREITSLSETPDAETTANYTIEVKSKYFKSRDIARDFIMELVELPRIYVASMNISYDAYLTAAETVLTYDEQISYLYNQADYIRGNYDSIINTFNGNFVVESGRILSSYRSELDAFMSSGIFDRLRNEAVQNSYIKDEDAIAEYNNQIYIKQRRLDIEDAVLQSLKAAMNNQSSVVVDPSQLLSQERLVQQLQQELADLEKLKDGVVNDTFDGQVESLQTRVGNFTDDFKKVASTVYRTTTAVNYADINIISTEGGTSLVSSLLIGLIIGVVAALIVAYCVGYYKMKKAREIKYSVSDPVYVEAEYQLAASDSSEDEEDGENKK